MDSAGGSAGDGRRKLHLVFLPYLAPGHMVSLVDVARLFAERGVHVSVVTTPGNAHLVGSAVAATALAGHSIRVHFIPFPSAEAGLPPGRENAAEVGDLGGFFRAIGLLQHPFFALLRDLSPPPDCIVADNVMHWASDAAAELGVPRLVFHASSPFFVSVNDQIELHRALVDVVASDQDHFVVPGGLPHRIQLTRAELPSASSPPLDLEGGPSILQLFQEAEKKSFGVVMNSFYELSPEYVELCKLGGARKVWCVGPVALINRSDSYAALRGGGGAANSGDDDVVTIKRWLDSKEPESVLYVCFGSENVFSNEQLRELAVTLEASGHHFIWVVRGGLGGADAMHEWLPAGFEERNKGKGIVWNRWAPQVFILNHPAVGGFVMHCGWNSCLEAICAGVPLVGWPIQWDNFILERLVIDVLGIGVKVLDGGIKRTNVVAEREVVSAEVLARAVARVMGGSEEAASIRKRAKEYATMAKAAMDKGGSSYNSLSDLIETLTVSAEERTKKREK